MIGGYARLSRDEDGQDYSSIQNQMIILEEAAKENGHQIDKWYIDDGISGYIFNRPGFNELQADLERELDILYVKDFSRIGRHNAKVLLFIEEFSYSSKRLIAVNEDYDSIKPDDDDIVGIKTWINERYVKDTSKKIRKVLDIKQKNGTLPYSKHFGYILVNKHTIKVCTEDAELIRYIGRLYVEGYGYRRLAERIEQEGYKTPSEALHERDILAGEKKPYPIVSTHWSENMIKEILDDDFYVGVRRLHKRHKQVIHGPDKRVPMEEQYIFYDDHDKIWDWDTWNLIQSLKKKRIRHAYRGSTEMWKGDKKKTIFPNILICSHCGHILTPIIRERKNGTYRKYYVCSVYNSKGSRYCPKSHLIEEKDLLSDIYTILKMAVKSISNILENINLIDFKKDKSSIKVTREDINSNIKREKSKLKEVLNQKVSDLLLADDSSKDVIKETYESLQHQIVDQIKLYEKQLNELDGEDLNKEESLSTIENARQFLDNLLEKELLEPSDFVLLFEKIEVDEKGFPHIIFRNDLSEIVTYDFEAALNAKENYLISQMLQWIANDNRGYTSIKFLKKHLDDNGTHRSKKAIETYLAIFQKMEILKYNPHNSLKPYTVLKKQEELLDISKRYIDIGTNRWNAGNGI